MSGAARSAPRGGRVYSPWVLTRRRNLDPAWGFTLLVLVASALAPMDRAEAQEESVAQLRFPTLPAETPVGSGLTQPCLGNLKGKVRCGRFRVWENRSTQTGRTIDLAFVVAEALDPQASHSSATTLFFGGPGSSVTGPAFGVIRAYSLLRRQNDLLLMDFRGVGNSGALDCGVPYPRGVESRFGSIFPLDQIAACRDRLSKRAQLDLYTSAHNVDDLDQLREWLNYRTLDLNGGSYGTREIQVYLRRHPNSVRTAILNSVSPVFQKGYVTHARGLQEALDELVRECQGQKGCSSAYPDLGKTLERVLQRVQESPPKVSAEGKTVRLGPGELGYALRGLLYSRAREVPALIYGAAEGQWQPLADYYLQRSGWVSDAEGEAGMHFSVLCAEDISQVDDEAIARETKGTFLGDYLIGGYADVCKIWPYARLDPSYWEPVRSDVPALFLSGTRDPVTPPQGGEAVSQYFSNSLHIVVPGAGHGVSGTCIDEIELRFVQTASIEGIDTSCIETRPPTAFVLPEDS
jgi:pimeloyl-ACP methyl ester carboxylesterase